MKKKRRIMIICLAVLAVTGIVPVIFKLSGIYDPHNIILGNNINTCFYHRSIGKEGYKVLEDAMKAVDKNYNKEKLLYRNQTGNVTKIFMLGENEVKGYEFLVRENGYFYIGERKLVFYDANLTREYSWEETLLSDLCCSTKKTYQNIIKIGDRYNVLPAWGVSDSGDINDITIDGQRVDEVIEFSQNETIYYLWMIHDLKTENDADDIIIGKR